MDYHSKKYERILVKPNDEKIVSNELGLAIWSC